MKFIIAIACIALVGCGGERTPEPLDDRSAKYFCRDLITRQLRDPDSYQFISSTVLSTNGEYDQYGESVVTFRSKNGFGGYVKGSAICTAYDNNGELWWRAKVN